MFPSQKEVVTANRLAALPSDFNTHVMLPQAHEYALALVKPPADVSNLQMQTDVIL